MHKNILVIGGTRHVGKLLVQKLVNAGHQVTIATRGRAPDPFGTRIKRIRVDRRDEAGMRRAFAGIEGYDVIYDQMCYSPLDAAIAVRIFSGRVKRYILASSVDVYRGLMGNQDGPFAETDLNVLGQLIDTRYPWHDPSRAVESYVAGKLQAEAYLYRDGSLPLVTARIGHVLAGPEDFTGRLAHYVDLVRLRAPLRYSNAAAASSFIDGHTASSFLAWAGSQDFMGPINAACDGGMSAFDMLHRAGRALDEAVSAIPAAKPAPAGELSPFDFPHALMMDTSRAERLGYRFGHIDEWADDIIRQHDLAFV